MNLIFIFSSNFWNKYVFSFIQNSLLKDKLIFDKANGVLHCFNVSFNEDNRIVCILCKQIEQTPTSRFNLFHNTILIAGFHTTDLAY